MRLIRSVHVTRRPGGDYRIHWTPDFSDTPVKLTASPDLDGLTDIGPQFEGLQESITLSDLDAEQRYYFRLQSEDGADMIVTERLLPLEGGTNFRDCGGYPAADGRRVKWNHLYRSGYMSRLSEKDVRYLSRLGIRVCCDFRGEDEQEMEPSLLPATTEIISLTIDPGSLVSYLQLASTGDTNIPDMSEMMEDLNLKLVEEHAGQYGAMLDQLLGLENGAFMVNCSAGKDRTGFGVALILMCLGVPREAIMHDYLLSKKYFSPSKELKRLVSKYSAKSHTQVDENIIMPMLQARESYLGTALDHIEREYGTPEAYLSQKFDIQAEALEVLRQRFTHS